MAIKFERKMKPKVVVDLIPMIDIVFQLVIFFMVATTFKTTSGIELELPIAKEVTNISTTPIQITIIDEENILINEKNVGLKDFEKVLKEQVINDPSIEQSVTIYGDKKIKYQLLIDVMDILRLSGFQSVDLAIKKKNLIE